MNKYRIKYGITVEVYAENESEAVSRGKFIVLQKARQWNFTALLKHISIKVLARDKNEQTQWPLDAEDTPDTDFDLEERMNSDDLQSGDDFHDDVAKGRY